MSELEDKFLKVIEENQGLLHKVCRLYSDNEADRNDLFQEIVFQLWQAYPAYEGRAKLSTWMYRVALYTAMNDLKKRKRKQQFEPALQGTSTNVADLNYDLQHVQEALGLLTAGDRALLALYIDEKSYKEIAEILGLTETNVGVRLNRIKKKLKKIMNVLDHGQGRY